MPEERRIEMNLILRLQNKVTLMSLIAAALGFLYGCFGLFGIVPSISESEIMNVIEMLISVLVGLGIVVDPTTKGIGDSEQAKRYDKPRSANDIETVIEYINEVVNAKTDVDLINEKTKHTTLEYDPGKEAE